MSPYSGDEPCTTTPNPNIFFAEPSNHYAIRQAVSICCRCGIVDACLKNAVENDERYGIWGGLTSAQRERIRKNPRMYTPR